MPDIENANTFVESLKTGISLYLGAGFSVYAKDSTGNPLPVGSHLADELVSEFNAQTFQSLDLPRLAAILEATRRDEFNNYLRRRFSVAEFDARYRVIRRVRLRSIFTVNIDNLLQRVFEHASPFFLHDITTHGPARTHEAIPYVPLHGCVANEGQRLTFTAVDIASTSSFDADRWRFLTTMLQREPLLFWGTQLVDSGVLAALNPKGIEGRSHQPKWIVLRAPDAALEQYYRTMGFAIIRAETGDLLDFLEKSVPTADPAVEVLTHRDARKLFPENCIPPPLGVPVRPLSEFYAGAEPTWYDIFSGQLSKTTHFASVLDLANSKRHGAVIGIPFSGKTTLLMQVAHELATDRYKLIFDALTPERAESVATRLAGEPAIIFVDNFTDSIEGYLQLMREDNVQIIGFDRDINYEVISHLIQKEPIAFVDVTELTETDLQLIFDKLPQESRAERLLRPEVAEGMAPSLFEFVECNIERPSLRTRIPKMLQALREKDSELFDWLVMFSYVTECRTAVSLDMIWAYLGGAVPTYAAIATRVKKLGAMIAEVSESDADDLGLGQEQDYYHIRSRVLSSAVIESVSNADLRAMLVRFHSEISPFRIVRFDVFRKSAYQARIMARAFSNPEEGKGFYEDTYNKQPNPYLLQQGAMYLSGKGWFNEAFRWIDQAIRDTHGRVLSIRNTHAIILFRANINAVGDETTIRRTLEESMRILGDLYREDQRKNYHVGTYARQAVEFWDRYQDQTALRYLRDAKVWLQNEIAKSPWNRILKQALSRVNGVLRRETPKEKDE